MIEAIVAVYGDWGIGANGTQPIVVSADRRHFREVTGRSKVIVGRKTLEDFPGGRPLKNRKNIVLTRQKLEVDGAAVAHSAEEALEIAGKYGRTFVIGGESVYRALFPEIRRVYVTKLDCVPESDAFFPNLDADPDWEIEEAGPEQTDESGVRFRFLTYVRRLTEEQQKALTLLRSKTPLTNIGTINAILRRSFTPSYVGEDAIVGYDDLCGVWYALGDAAAQLPPADQTTKMFITDRAELVPVLKRNYGLADGEEYRILVWPREEPPKMELQRLQICHPTDEEMRIINETYDMADMEELQRDRGADSLFTAHDPEGQMVGYMGIHSDTSMGLLQVFPEHRRKGYAEELERFMIAAALSRGLTPFGQVAPDNAASLRLQKKLGLVEAPGSIWYVWH